MVSKKNKSTILWLARRVAACALVCVLTLTALVTVPAVAAETDADNVGTTLIGLLVTDSSKNQSVGEGGKPGESTVGLRVTNSGSTKPIIVRVTFHSGTEGAWSDGSHAQEFDVQLLELTLPPSSNPTRPDYEFDCWVSEDGVEADFTRPTVESTDWYARWKAIPYDIFYNLGDGKNADKNPATYDIETSVTLADALPPEGFQFDGWTCEQLNITKPKKEPTIPKGTKGDLTFEASFSLANYIVTFNSNGGSEVASQEVTYRSTVTKPADPTRGGYEFLDWYKDKDLTIPWNFDTDTVPAKEMTLYAKWAEHIVCDVPIPVTLTVDAAGQVSEVLQNGKSYKFVSGTTAPIVVASATSTLLAGADTLFPDEAAKKDVAILIKPEGDVQKSIPLATSDPIALGFHIDTKQTLPVSFGLYLPATARLNYLVNDGTAEIASISYTVSLATP